VQELRIRLVQNNQEVVRAALQTASSGATQLIAIGGIALVLGIALAWLISRGIIGPLKAMTDAITRLASGDGAVKIPETASRSELGAMARAVNVFRQNFRELGDKARRTAISVGETNAAVVQVSEGARTQTAKLSKIALALRESTGALKSVADNTKAASDKATRASELVKTGLSSVERLAAVVEVSAQNSRKVNQISQVIGQIANRTHILSLNAAIEAARAGEHGKGFVVVAQEVGKLAESAGQNAKPISEIVEQATDDASEGRAAAEAARGAINGVALGANDTTRMIHSSAAAIEEQQMTTRRSTKT
jgi:methyl-accepting chemotaxis protein